MKFFCIGILQQPTGKISKFPEEFATSFSNLQSYVRKIPNELGTRKSKEERCDRTCLVPILA